MEMAADGRLWLIGFGPDDGMKPFAAFADVSVAPEEVHGPGAEAEELRHPGVVIVIPGEVTIGAILRRPDAAGRVRKMRVERLAAVTFRRKSLSLRIDPFAVRILRA